MRIPRGRTRRALLALTALALLAAANWWLTRPPPHAAVPTGTDAEPIDYALEDFHARFFDRDGVLALEVRGPTLRHSARTRIAEIDAPEFVLSPGGDPWTGRARIAEIERDAGRLRLVSDVVIDHDSPRGPLRIRTDELVYERGPQQLVAPGEARIEQGGDTLTGGTLTLWIDDERFELADPMHAILRDADRASDAESEPGTGAGGRSR